MAQSKKYQIKLSQDESGWKADVLRQASSRKTVVSKTQNGFATEAAAQAWADEALAEFLAKLKARNAAKTAARKKA